MGRWICGYDSALSLGKCDCDRAAMTTTVLDRCYPDHLGTPRAITTSDATNTKVWEWKNDDPFGNNAPNEDPSTTGTAFKYNNRFPGQYFDQETNTSYNYFRDYDPSIGRYIQSDPIGLKGGISTFSYVNAKPLLQIDRLGLLSSGNHHDYTQQAMDEIGLTCPKLKNLVDLVPAVDVGTQDARFANLHSMTRPDQPSTDAGRDASRNIINRSLSSCTKLGLATAIHDIQDSTSDAHAGYPFYYGLLQLPYFGIKHGLQDYFPGDAVKQEAIDRTKSALREFLATCPCACN